MFTLIFSTIELYQTCRINQFKGESFSFWFTIALHQKVNIIIMNNCWKKWIIEQLSSSTVVILLPDSWRQAQPRQCPEGASVLHLHPLQWPCTGIGAPIQTFTLPRDLEAYRSIGDVTIEVMYVMVLSIHLFNGKSKISTFFSKNNFFDIDKKNRAWLFLQSKFYKYLASIVFV